jgi:hypothetical protein
MQRRQFLGAAAGLGAIAVAGCTGDTDGPADDSATPSPTPTDTPTTSVVGTEVTTLASDCRSDDPAADIVFDTENGRLVVRGTMATSNPCHRAVLSDVRYDADADRLAVAVASEAESGGCMECLGQVSYEAVVRLSGAVPNEATVSHDGQPIASAAYASDSASASPPNGEDGTGSRPAEDDTSTPFQGVELETRSFAVTGVENGQQRNAAAVSFDPDADRVTVTGTIWGASGCATARLAGASYDRETDRLVVTVDTATEGEACTDAIVEVGYEGTFGFSNGLPGEVAVRHRDTGVTTAAYGAASADGS